MMVPFFSIVIPFYNRAWSLERAVASAVDFHKDTPTEIVLVDDGSTDGSAEVATRLISKYSGAPSLTFKLIAHVENKGVCAAKNTGARAAVGEWIIFLDSDDELIHSCMAPLRAALNSLPSYPLHFFASVDERDEAINQVEVHALRDFTGILLRGTGGEALPVVRTEVFQAYGYDEDIRGYESLCYLRIARDYEHVVLHSLIARRYYTEHSDRLSSRLGMKTRWRELSRGHLRVLTEHKRIMTVPVAAKQIMRLLKSSFLSIT
jgi:glycosyltransferase involved in cell wall biosynthesis